MTAKLSHDRAIEELELVALGAAPADVAAGLRTHATSCEECRKELAALTVMLADMTDVFPDRQLNRGRSAGIRSRLLARADADTDAAAKRRVAAAAVAPAAGVERDTRTPAAERAAVPPRARHTTPFGEQRAPIAAGEHAPRVPRTMAPAPLSFAVRAWAVVATIALVVALAALLTVGRDEDAPETFAGEAERADGAARVDSLERLVRERDVALQTLAAPTLRIVSLTNWSAGGRPLARMFWDPRANRWTLFVYELRQPRDGRTYQVWLGTPDRRISAGTFVPGADGRAMLTATQEVPAAALRTVTVTEEPAGGSQEPTGSVLLAGSASP